VYPPEKTYLEKLNTCSNTLCELHGKYLNDSFCGKCGSAITFYHVQRKGHVNMEDFLEEKFNNIDLFRVIFMDDKDYQIFIPNMREQGGVHIEEHGEYSLPENINQFEHKDWIALINKLEEEKFNFEKKIGVVAYYN